MRKPTCLRSSNYLIITIIIIPLLVIGCSGSNELTRSKAKELILSNAEYPKDITRMLLIERNSMAPSGIKVFEYHANQLNQSGLAKAVFEENGSTITLKVTFNDKGKQYIRGEEKPGPWKMEIPVLTKVERFEEITGIVFKGEQKSTAFVEYTTSIEPTPFDAVFTEDSKSYKVNREAYFKLYDDGWRVQM